MNEEWVYNKITAKNLKHICANGELVLKRFHYV
jgi:hypothetical protein